MIGLCLIFFLSRILYLHFLDPYYYSIFPPEERYIGAMAKELLSGLSFPYWNYQANPYLGGSLVMGLMVAALFKFLGTSLFVVKLPSLILFGTSLIIWMILIARHFGRKVAIYFAILYTFSPLSFMQYSVTTLGTHSDTILFAVLSLYLFFKILYEDKDTWLTYTSLGLVCGLGFWFSPIFTIHCVSLAIVWVLHKKPIISKKLLGTLIGFIFGCLPWILYNLHHGFAGLVIYDTHVSSHFGFDRLVDGLRHYRLSSPYRLLQSFASPFWGMPKEVNVLSMKLYGFSFLLVWGGLLYVFLKKREALTKPLLFFFVYPLIFLFIAQLSDFSSVRYFIPLHPFLYVWVAFTAVQLIGTPRMKFPLSQSVLGIFVLVGIFTLSPVLSWSSKGQIYKTRGYRYQLLYDSICKKPLKCTEKYEAFQSKLSSEDLRDFESELASHFASSLPLQNIRKEVHETEPHLAEEIKNYFYYFLGRTLIEEKSSVEASFEEIRFLKIKNQSAYRLAGMGILLEGATDPDVEIPQNLPLEADGLVRFLGVSQGEAAARMTFEEKGTLEAIGKILDETLQMAGPATKTDFSVGVGKYLYGLWSCSVLNPPFEPASLLSFPKESLEDLFYGVGIEMAKKESLWRIAPRPWYWEQFTDGLSETNKADILLGKTSLQELLSGE